ncbi:MAG: L-aspartate oxidase [Chitinophagales bacterium]
MKTETFDIVVIGSGIAGLSYAMRCAEFAQVAIVTKGSIGESNTMYAQGGIAAVFDDNDSISNHVADTLTAGDGLCDKQVVELLARNAKEAILYLEQLQVNFNKTQSGTFDLHREGGHSHARIVHHADATGKEVENSLVKAVHNCKNITILENHFAVDVVVNNNKCKGIIAFNPATKKFIGIASKLTMLASGGAGQIYLQNTNPAVATGDGFAMAYRAGAEMMDMEFVQFHPTTLFAKEKETFLITEAIRGFGAELKNKNGIPFMENQHPLKSLAPRDIVTRAIISEMDKTGSDCVYLDLTSFNQQELAQHFPNIYQRCKEENINPATDMIPVVPAAHYVCGGIHTNLEGNTTVEYLYACGECTGTGVHGANRLASNSLLEGLVFAKQAAHDSQNKLLQMGNSANNNEKYFDTPYFEALKICTTCSSKLTALKWHLQTLMWHNCGIIRTESKLDSCLQELESIENKVLQILETEGFSILAMELLNMVESSKMICTAALNRKESRGCHFRSDYPQKNNAAIHSKTSLKTEQ